MKTQKNDPVLDRILIIVGASMTILAFFSDQPLMLRWFQGICGSIIFIGNLLSYLCNKNTKNIK